MNKLNEQEQENTGLNEKYKSTQFNEKNIINMLPDQSLRVTSTVHTKVNAVKQVGIYENVSDVLDEALDELLKKYTNEQRQEVDMLEKTSINNKILKYKRQSKRSK